MLAGILSVRFRIPDKNVSQRDAFGTGMTFLEYGWGLLLRPAMIYVAGLIAMTHFFWGINSTIQTFHFDSPTVEEQAI